MTRTPDTEQAPLLSRAHRVIRILDSGDEPFSGALVTDGDAVVVARDAAVLSGWEGWRFAGSEHVAAPLDLIRRPDGHDVLLPWCTERVGVFLARRSGAGEPLTPGESSTLVVSLLRALAELGSNGCADVGGTWWLTEEGRPVFVIGVGEPARAGVCSLVERLGEQNRDRTLGRLLTAMRAGLEKNVADQPGVPQLLLERWEKELLDIASPRALRRGALTPELAGAGARPGVVEQLQVSPRRASRRVRAQSGARARPSRLVTVMRRCAAGLREGVDRLVARVAHRRGSRADTGASAGVPHRAADAAASRTGPRRPLVLAGAAAAAVLACGLLWPTGGEDDAAGSDRRPSPAHADGRLGSRTASPSSTASAADEAASKRNDSTEGDANAVKDPVAVAAALWQLIAECGTAEDAVCERAVVPGAVGVVEAVAADSNALPAFAAIDQYGDIAVVRADEAEAGHADEHESTGETVSAGKVLVLVRLNEKWLVRARE
jgi:hypothetical protein